ncbi:family 20 glycosylhydrolase [Nocardiopsis composta]|uniref:beta-N-acetylhexosaminidase n=2 Tax=Nocardiopsis composta TaxID=157465 RepID=A0A7W8QI97_9ACTN|nr:family 20 glycosylhydrolase [Nocardiopsis composta]MBB5430876.1 hexosaminidase [Nocardiopsis composta]
MSAIIPAPTSPPASGGAPAAGRWSVTAGSADLEGMLPAVRALADPHLARIAAAAGPGAPRRRVRLELGPVPGGPPALGVPPDGEGPRGEAYALEVGGGADGDVVCRAPAPRGVFRAATAAIQLLATGDRLPCGRFADAPRIAWRGLLLDPARRFLPPAELRRLIDLAALYRLNVVHLHLTDDQGWRLELPGRPRLTPPGTGHYTARDYAGLQAYAAERFVTVVPEIDLPGHCAAALRAHPELGTMPRPAGMDPRFPYTPPLDPRDPAARRFIDDVLSETAALTAGRHLHVGGDEAVGISGDDFAAAVRLARRAARAAGKTPVGWQEAFRGGLGAGDIGQFWVDPEMMDLPAGEHELAGRPELLRAGYTMPAVEALRRFFAPSAGDLRRILDSGGRVLLSPQSHLYLDRPYEPGTAPPEQAAAARRVGFAYRPRTVRHAAGWDPAAYREIPADRLAGVEATLFAETVRGFDDLVLLLLPRLPGIAQAAWAAAAADWTEHRRRLAAHTRLWRDRGLTPFRTTEVDWE